jgi:hypothetical protein
MMQKNSAEMRTVYAIKDENGIVHETQLEVIQEVRRQYECLFTSVGQIDENAATMFLSQPPHGSADETDRLELGGEISEDEIKCAVRSFEKKKTPGSDGLPIEFYLLFLSELGMILNKVYAASLRLEKLPGSCYYGIISQLYKGDGDKKLRSSWRPLTMLNVDHKILAKVLVLRLKKVMRKIVHPDQTCSVPGRDIRDGVLTLYNAIIEWEYMHKVLEGEG